MKQVEYENRQRKNKPTMKHSLLSNCKARRGRGEEGEEGKGGVCLCVGARFVWSAKNNSQNSTISAKRPQEISAAIVVISCNTLGMRRRGYFEIIKCDMCIVLSS